MSINFYTILLTIYIDQETNKNYTIYVCIKIIEAKGLSKKKKKLNWTRVKTRKRQMRSLRGKTIF